MSEREYFSLRYAIPGFTLILIIIGINYVPLLKIMEITRLESAFGAFLAFLSLFTGSAIGFLVSQVWWCWLRWRRIILNVFKPMEDTLITKCGFKPPRKKDEEQKVVSAILDFLLLKTDSEKFWKYAQRRWDMFHVFSSTLVTMIIAYILGIILRIYYEFSIFQGSFKVCNTGFLAEVGAQVFVLLCVITLVLLILWARGYVFDEYVFILNALIEDPELNKELLKAFPDYFKKE